MKPHFFAMAAVLIGSTLAMGEPQITTDGTFVRVPVGDFKVGEQTVHVVEPATFSIEMPIETPATEHHVLTTDKPLAYLKGTHLEGLRSGGTPLPDCLDPASAKVSLPDGTMMTAGKDYLFDAKWAAFSRVEGGRIGADVPVTINFLIGKMRLDAIEVDDRGVVHRHKGEEKMTCPHPPETPAGFVAIANVFVPYHATSIESWQIFRITEPKFPVTATAESLVSKTLGKLRNGKPVTIVAWGDSVTVGGEASSHDKIFPELFVARLRERFPESKITNFNAGIGATTSEQRLPDLQKQVLDFHPDLVTMEYVNDMGHTEAAIRERYPKIFKQIRDAGAEVILVTPHFTMTSMMGKEHPRGGETRANVALIRAIAAEQHVALADTSRRWEHLDAEGIPYLTLLQNGINHPDDRAHEMFAEDLMFFFPR